MKFEGNALSIGRVMGIPIRVHISLLILLALVLFGNTSMRGMLASFLIMVGLFGSIALHELGHSIAARMKGSRIHEIMLYPFGGVAKIIDLPRNPFDEFIVAAAGPAVSLALALFFASFHNPIMRYLGFLNMMLFRFNLIPAFPMDGGRMLRAVLALKKGRVEATRIAVSIGKFFCVLFFFYGLSQMNFLLMFIAVYLYFAGEMEYRMVLLESRMPPFFRDGPPPGGNDIEVGPPPYA